MSPLKDKTAVVTGGTRGIGRAIAEALMSQGANVMIAARRGDDVERAVKAMQALGPGSVDGMVCDVRQPAQVQALIDFAERRFSGLDILVNNAGVGFFKPVDEMPPEVWSQVIETNLNGVFYACHWAVPKMRARGGGYIVNLGSLAGKNAFAGGGAYNASKFGLIGFSEALMLENRYHNIRVTCIMPGSVNTEFGGDAPDPSKSWQLTPADIAQAVLCVLTSEPRAMISQLEIRPSKPAKK